jgi:hypothetical protein
VADTNVTPLRPAVKDRTAAERQRRRRQRKRVTPVPTVTVTPVTGPVTPRRDGGGMIILTTVAALALATVSAGFSIMGGRPELGKLSAVACLGTARQRSGRRSLPSSLCSWGSTPSGLTASWPGRRLGTWSRLTSRLPAALPTAKLRCDGSCWSSRCYPIRPRCCSCWPRLRDGMLGRGLLIVVRWRRRGRAEGSILSLGRSVLQTPVSY